MDVDLIFSNLILMKKFYLSLKIKLPFDAKVAEKILNVIYIVVKVVNNLQ